jgi:hypothetical protein
MLTEGKGDLVRGGLKETGVQVSECNGKELYTGIDLHSNNSHIGIIDQEDKRIFL